MSEIYILLFYKYVKIEDLEKFRDQLLNFCDEVGLFGRILVSEEGINGSVSGTKEQVEQYKEYLKADERFNEIVFKEDIGKSHSFTKMKVLIKKEVVNFGQEVNLENKGIYLEPKEVFEMYEKEEDFIMLDARNDYEFKVGHFEDSINLNIKTFRQFPEKINELKDLKDKKIVMCCTGGIRCEKASAFLKENGFKKVFHIKDGIINYVKQYPDTYWKGKLFVFDKRMVTSVNNSDESITNCELCGTSCDLCMNCRNLNCDKLFVACLNCQHNFHHCCSEKCMDEFLIKCNEKSLIRQGRRG